MTRLAARLAHLLRTSLIPAPAPQGPSRVSIVYKEPRGQDLGERTHHSSFSSVHCLFWSFWEEAARTFFPGSGGIRTREGLTWGADGDCPSALPAGKLRSQFPTDPVLLALESLPPAALVQNLRLGPGPRSPGPGSSLQAQVLAHGHESPGPQDIS